MADLKILFVKDKIPSGLLNYADKSDELVIMNIPDSNRSAVEAILAVTDDDYFNVSGVVTETEGAVNGIPLPKEAGKKYQ